MTRRILFHERNIIVIPKELFPSGVLHFILFDAGMNPVSERLFFIHHQDQAQVTYQPDKTQFATRSSVKNMVTVADSEGQPLSDSFSVAVTSDKEVTTDSTSGHCDVVWRRIFRQHSNG